MLEELLNEMKRAGVLRSKRLEHVLREVPRHEFVPENMKRFAYDDYPLSIGNCQTISQPSTVVIMTEALDVREDSKVLEVGAGSGWQAAILAKLAYNGFVYTAEIEPELAEFARKNLQRLKIKNVRVFNIDGSIGLKRYAPFDRIIITAAAPEIPKPLIEQLKVNGRLVAPIGGKHAQRMAVAKKLSTGVEVETLPEEFAFVPLRGRYGFKQ